MHGPIEPLVLDLVEWVSREQRLYGEVMDAWRTSCPRLTVWEDAIDRGLVQREMRPDIGCIVVPTPLGQQLLKEAGRVAVQRASDTAR